MKKVALAIMILTALILALASCNKGAVPKSYMPLVDGSESTVVIVRPDSSSEDVKTMAMSIKDDLSDKLGVDVKVAVDWGFDASKYPENTYFLCIGQTELEATKSFVGSPKGDMYGVKLDGNMIVVSSNKDVYLDLAVEKFMESVVEKNGTYYLDKDKLNFVGKDLDTVSVVKDGNTDYTIVCEETKIDPKKDTHYSLLLADEITKSFKDHFGADIARQDDNTQKAGKEIIIGACPRRKNSEKLTRALSYDEYGITVEKDGSILLYGKNYELTSKAVDKFLEIAQGMAGGDSFELANVFSRTFKIYGLPKVPLIEGSTDFKLASSVLDSFALHYSEKDVKGFEKYVKELEKAGFEQVARNEINGNIFTTYQNDKAIVNCYFTARNNTVKVCVDSKKNTVIHNYEPTEAEKTTTPMLVQFTSGCGYLLRLEDGTFIVFDGGLDNATNYKNLYNSLKQYNVTSGKPRIRAWIFSHPHSDHLGGFFAFTENYAGTVDIEQFVFNNPTRAHYHETIDDPPTGATILENRINKFLGYCEKFYSNTDVVTAHTGQIMYFGKTKAEILHTHEDDFPMHISKGNQISLLVRFTFGDQTILFTGDMHENSAPIITEMFGDHLKSDIVQMAHHGYNGGTPKFYKTVGAKVCLLPNTVAKYHELKDKTQNKTAVSLAEQVLVPENDKDIIAVELPYKNSYGEKWNRK